MKLLYIEWEDAISPRGSWWDQKEAEDWADETESFVAEIGWLVKETKRYIFLANKKFQHQKGMVDVGGLTRIPKTWVRKRKEIKIK